MADEKFVIDTWIKVFMDHKDNYIYTSWDIILDTFDLKETGISDHTWRGTLIEFKYSVKYGCIVKYDRTEWPIEMFILRMYDYIKEDLKKCIIKHL